MTIIGIGTISLTDLADAIISGSQPSSTEEGQLWIDNSDPSKPPVLKVYKNGKWVIQSLDIKKMDEGLAKEINKLTETIGSMVNDNKLDINERASLVKEISRIIGVVPSTSTEVLAPYTSKLPTSEELDQSKKGEFARTRIAATKIGIKADSPEYTNFANAYNSLALALKSYGDNSSNVYPWDITDRNKSRNVDVNANEFRQKWLDYYNALSQLESAILSVPGPAGQSPAVLSLSNETIVIPTDDKGNNAIYDQATTYIKVYIGGSDTTSEWNITHSKASGEVAYTVDTNSPLGHKYVITKLDSDLASIEITATKEGYDTLKRTINISKVKTGERAILEYLDLNTSAISKDALGNMVPSEIIVRGLRKEGNLQAEESKYIYEISVSSSNENSLRKVYTSPNDGENKYTFNVNQYKDNLKLINIVMKDVSTKSMIDSQSIVVVSDGIDGTSPLFVDLSNDSVVINTDSKGNSLIGSYTYAYTDVRVFLGSKEITNNSDVNIEFVASSGVEMTSTRTRATVTHMSGNSGKVTAIVTYKSERMTKDFILAKNRNGLEGQPAVIRRLIGPNVINLNDNIKSYTYSLAQTVGNQAETDVPNVDFKIKVSNHSTYWKEFNSKESITITKEDVVKLNDQSSLTSGLTIEAILNGVIVDREIITIVKNGRDGRDGESVTNNEVFYILSKNDSKPNQNDPNWTKTAPSVSKRIGNYTWMKSVITYSSGRREESDPVLISTPQQVLKIIYANLNKSQHISQVDSLELVFNDNGSPLNDNSFRYNLVTSADRITTVTHIVKIPTNKNLLKDFGIFKDSVECQDGVTTDLKYERIGEEEDNYIYRMWFTFKVDYSKSLVYFNRIKNPLSIFNGKRIELLEKSVARNGYLYSDVSDSPVGREYRGEVLTLEGSQVDDLDKYSWNKLRGADGKEGKAGIDGVTYSLELSEDSIRKTVTGVYEPGVIEIKLRKSDSKRSYYIDKRNIKVEIIDDRGNTTLFNPTNTTETERIVLDVNKQGKDVNRINIKAYAENSTDNIVHTRTILVVKDSGAISAEPYLNISASEGNVYTVEGNTVKPSENIIKSEIKNMNQVKYTWFINGQKVKSSSDVPAYELVTKSSFIAGDVKADTGEIIPSGEANSNTWVTSSYLHKREDSVNFIVIGGMPNGMTCKLYQFDVKGRYLGVSKILEPVNGTVKELDSNTRQIAVVFKHTSKINVGDLESYKIRIVYSNNSSHATSNFVASRDNLPFDALKITSSDMMNRDLIKVMLEAEGVNDGRVVTLTDSLVLNKISRENDKTYTWKAYAESPTGDIGFTLTPSPNSKYIGFAFNKVTETPSTNKDDYIWVPNNKTIKELDDKIKDSKDLEDKGSQNIFSVYDFVGFIKNDAPYTFNTSCLIEKSVPNRPFEGGDQPMCIQLKRNDSGYYESIMGDSYAFSLDANKKYTFSMWVFMQNFDDVQSEYASFSMENNFVELSINGEAKKIKPKKTDNSNLFKFSEGSNDLKVAIGKWVRVAFTFKSNENAEETNYFRFRINVKGSLVSDIEELYIAGIQLEEGDNLTTYSKSVRDIIHSSSLRNYALKSSELKFHSHDKSLPNLLSQYDEGYKNIEGHLSKDVLKSKKDDIYTLSYDMEIKNSKVLGFGLYLTIGYSDRFSEMDYTELMTPSSILAKINYINSPNPVTTKIRVHREIKIRENNNEKLTFKIAKFGIALGQTSAEDPGGEIIISNIVLNKGSVAGQYISAPEDQKVYFEDSIAENLVVTDNFLNLERFRLSSPLMVEPTSDSNLFGEYNALEIKEVRPNMLFDTDVSSLNRQVFNDDRFINGVLGSDNYILNPIFKKLDKIDRPSIDTEFAVEFECIQAGSPSVYKDISWYKNTNINFEPNTFYTLSYYVRKISGNPVVHNPIREFSVFNETKSSIEELKNNEWVKVYKVFKANNPVKFPLTGITAERKGVLQFTGFKLEKAAAESPYVEASRPFTIEVDDLEYDTDYYISFEARVKNHGGIYDAEFPVKLRPKNSKYYSLLDMVNVNDHDMVIKGDIKTEGSGIIGKKINSGKNRSMMITFPINNWTPYYVYKIQVKKSDHYIPYTPSSKDISQASYTTTLTQDNFIFNANEKGKVISSPSFPNNVSDVNLYVNGRKTKNFNMSIIKKSSDDIREGYDYEIDNTAKTLKIINLPSKLDYGWIMIGVFYANNLVDIKKVNLKKNIPNKNYTWTAYADDVDKTTLKVKGFSFEKKDKAWIGIARNMPTATPNDDYYVYEWYTVAEERSLNDNKVDDRDSGEGKDYIYTSRGQEGGLAQLVELNGLGHEFMDEIDEIPKNYIYESSFAKEYMENLLNKTTEGEMGRWFVYDKAGSVTVTREDNGTKFQTGSNGYIILRCPIYRLPTNNNPVLSLHLHAYGNDSFKSYSSEELFNNLDMNIVCNYESEDFSFNFPSYDNTLKLEYNITAGTYGEDNRFSGGLTRKLKILYNGSPVNSGYRLFTFTDNAINDTNPLRGHYTISSNSIYNGDIVEQWSSGHSPKTGEPLTSLAVVAYRGTEAYAFYGKYKPKHNKDSNERFKTKIPFVPGAIHGNYKTTIPGSVGKMYLEIFIHPNRTIGINGVSLGETVDGESTLRYQPFSPVTPSIGYPKDLSGIKDFNVIVSKYQESIMTYADGYQGKLFKLNKFIDTENNKDTYDMTISYTGVLNNLYSITNGNTSPYYLPDIPGFNLSNNIDTDKDITDPLLNPKFNLQTGGDFRIQDGGFYKGWTKTGSSGITYTSSDGMLRIETASGNHQGIIHTRGNSLSILPGKWHTVIVDYRYVSGDATFTLELITNNHTISIPLERGKTKAYVTFNKDVIIGASSRLVLTTKSTSPSVFEIGKIMVLPVRIDYDKDLPSEFIGTQEEETGVARRLSVRRSFRMSDEKVARPNEKKYMRYFAGLPNNDNRKIKYSTNSNYNNHASGLTTSGQADVMDGKMDIRLYKNIRNADELYISPEEYYDKKNYRNKNVNLNRPLYRISDKYDTLYLNEDDGKYYVKERIGVLVPKLDVDSFKKVGTTWEFTISVPDLKWSEANINENIIVSNMFITKNKGNRNYMRVDRAKKEITFVIPTLDICYDPRKDDKKLIEKENPYYYLKRLESMGIFFKVYYAKENETVYDLGNNKSAVIALNSLGTFEGSNYFSISTFYPTNMKVKFRSKARATGNNINNIIQEMSERADNFERNLGKSLLDNIITDREKASINNDRRLLENEHTQLVAQYAGIPNDVSNKSALDSSKNVYENGFKELIAKIDEIIQRFERGNIDDITSKRLKDELSAGFNTYRLNLRNFVLEMQKSLVSKMDNIVKDIESKNYVKSTEFEKLDTAFRYRINKAGGMNMLKNSTGYIWSTRSSNDNMWKLSSGDLTNISTDLSPVYNSLGTGCGFKITAPSNRDVIMYQSLSTSPGRYSLDLFFKNDHTKGGNQTSFQVKVINGDISKINSTNSNIIPFSLESNSKTTATSSTDLDNFRYTKYLNGFEYVNPESKTRINPFPIIEGFSDANPYNLTVAIIVKAGNTVTLSGIMLKGGEISSWTPHPSENYSGSVTMDSSGITVKDNNGKNYTVMSTKEFAGYYVGDDGVHEKIFTLSGDETQVKNLYVKGKYMRLGNLVLEVVDDGNGWFIYKL